MKPNVEVTLIRLITNQILEEPLSETLQGFTLSPEFKNGQVYMHIISNLFIPVGGRKLHCATQSSFRLHDYTQHTAVQDFATLAKLIQLSLAHTRLYILTKTPKVDHPPLTIPPDSYFIPDIKRQLKERGLLQDTSLQ